MPDASPTKWHLAHTTWFFETFVLAPNEPNYRVHDERWGFLFNSYYEAVGARQPRPLRGMLTRPSVDEVLRYRRAIDDGVRAGLESGRWSNDVLDLVELGVHHEQQHQELLLTDIQHLLSLNPLAPAYTTTVPAVSRAAEPPRWIESAGGVVPIGHRGADFSFDNESPAHDELLRPFEVRDVLVTCAEFAAFIADGGYARPELWLSDGWAAVQSHEWKTPLYWHRAGTDWQRFSLHGRIDVDPAAPVTNISFYEADAFARWANARLPMETEWEHVARDFSVERGQFLDSQRWTPVSDGTRDAWFGSAWVWTASPYLGYPGFRPAAGAVGEYNGKFMCNQFVLRGGSCFTPPGHVRRTYRNFFPPHARWQATGIRLARDADRR